MSETAPAPSLKPYLAVQATQFAAGGMMAVLFPWLITHELHESQAGVGIAQMVANIPFLFLVLIAGVIADGRDLRLMVSRIVMCASLMPILMALMIATGNLNIYSICALMFVTSILGAFVTPARDAMLSHVMPPDVGLTQAAAMSVAATFGGQVIGTLIAATASEVGAVPLLAFQSVLLVITAVTCARLRISVPFELKEPGRPNFKKMVGELTDGFKVVSGHERLGTIVLYLLVGAPLFNGVFLVGLPLLARDVYQGSSALLSAMIVAFLTGLSLSSFAFSRRHPVKRPGRLLMILGGNNVLVFTLLHFAPPVPYCIALLFAWGLSSGVSMSLTRGMIQVAAPQSHRARVLAILQFANMAGSPIGALIFGFLSQGFGVLNAILVLPIAVILYWIYFRFQTNLWQFKDEGEAADAAPPIVQD